MKMNAGHYDDMFTSMYSMYYERAVRLICRITGNDDISREIAQDVFIQVYKNITRISSEKGSLKFYILTIARNRAIDYLRKKSVEEARYREKFLEEVVLDGKFYDAIENCFIEGEIFSTLHDTINEFPETERLVFIGKNFENKTFADLCQSSNLSFYKIKKIEQKMRGRIRRSMASFF